MLPLLTLQSPVRMSHSVEWPLQLQLGEHRLMYCPRSSVSLNPGAHCSQEGPV